MITPTRPRRTALRAARLFDGTRTAPDPLVLVEDGLIAAVEFGPRAPVPPDALLIDLPGATLLPGLIDTHVHLAFDGGLEPVAALAGRDRDGVLAAMADAAAAQLRAGVTTVRDLGDRDFLALDLRESAAGPLPTIVAAGPPITSVDGHCHFLGGTVSGVDGVRAAVREHAARGVDVIKVMASGGMMTPGTDVHAPQFSPAELRALVDEAHRHGLPVTAHAHALDAIASAVEAGVDGLEHCSFLTADGIVVPDRLVEAIVARRIVVGATLGFVPTDLDVKPPPGLLEMLPRLMAVLARLCRDGAVVVAGTDAGIAPVKPHGVLPSGLVQLAQLAGGPESALRAGTHLAAQVCGLGDRKGRVAPGFDADLLAVDGDPRSDISAVCRPLAVLASGEVVLRPALTP